METDEIQNRVREARRIANLSQQDLADAVGVTRQTIGLIEANKYNPSIRICLKISAATGWELSDLFYISPEEQ